MNRKPAKRKKPQHLLCEEELAAGLRKTLAGKYGKILEAARRKWEQEFGAIKEPGDASVAVHTSDAPGKRRAPRGRLKRNK